MTPDLAKKGTVLVVEDEPLIRMMAMDLAEEAGFETVGTADADEAIRILESRADIRIVFTDIRIPGSMDGLKLAVLIRRRWPPIELIITSGHYRVRDVELPARSVFFSKPYSVQDVIATFRRMAA